ncbi:hypothetical protein [Nostoc sp.]|uniref:hypothetical protein n=1 Tax=Nostoc sp. TaxID=1180 RepID=UPI002FF719AA
MEIKYGASQRILISVSQDTKYGDIQSDRGGYPSYFNPTSECAKAHATRTLKQKLKKIVIVRYQHNL